MQMSARVHAVRWEFLRIFGGLATIIYIMLGKDIKKNWQSHLQSEGRGSVLFRSYGRQN